MNNLEDFCRVYDIKDAQKIESLYEIGELLIFMPPNPTAFEKQVFQKLIGVQGEVGYLDYNKSNNTFELLMQWREQTNNL